MKREGEIRMKKSIIVLLVVLFVIGVAAIGIAASKKGHGDDDQGQDNNDRPVRSYPLHLTTLNR